jgi:hypothetical protein
MRAHTHRERTHASRVRVRVTARVRARPAPDPALSGCPQSTSAREGDEVCVWWGVGGGAENEGHRDHPSVCDRQARRRAGHDGRPAQQGWTMVTVRVVPAARAASASESLKPSPTRTARAPARPPTCPPAHEHAHDDSDGSSARTACAAPAAQLHGPTGQVQVDWSINL